MLEKTFQPAVIEPRIANEWEKAQAFKAGRGLLEFSPKEDTISCTAPRRNGSVCRSACTKHTRGVICCPMRSIAGAASIP